MRFEFATAGRILFGEGSLYEAPSAADAKAFVASTNEDLRKLQALPVINPGVIAARVADIPVYHAQIFNLGERSGRKLFG